MLDGAVAFTRRDVAVVGAVPAELVAERVRSGGCRAEQECRGSDGGKNKGVAHGLDHLPLLEFVLQVFWSWLWGGAGCCVP